MAAAVGSGLPVKDARGSMIADIGGGTTDVAVISLGLVASPSLRVAGDNWTTQSLVSQTQNILIGERTAELIKMKMAQPTRWIWRFL